MPKPNTQRASDLLASVTADMIASGTTFEPTDSSLRVEKIILELVRPHPVQPRRVLPKSIPMTGEALSRPPHLSTIENVSIACEKRKFSYAFVWLPGKSENDPKIVQGDPSSGLFAWLLTYGLTHFHTPTPRNRVFRACDKTERSLLPLNFIIPTPDLLQLPKLPFPCDAEGIRNWVRKVVDKTMGGCVMRECVGCAAILVALTACLWLALHALRWV